VDLSALLREAMLDVIWVLRKVSVELCLCADKAVSLGGAGGVGSGLEVGFKPGKL
jgi:hypothetical protein